MKESIKDVITLGYDQSYSRDCLKVIGLRNNIISMLTVLFPFVSLAIYGIYFTGVLDDSIVKMHALFLYPAILLMAVCIQIWLIERSEQSYAMLPYVMKQLQSWGTGSILETFLHFLSAFIWIHIAFSIQNIYFGSVVICTMLWLVLVTKILYVRFVRNYFSDLTAQFQ